MKLTVLVSLFASAAAFAPSKVAQTPTSLSAFEGELGVQAPIGFFDPLGMLDNASQDQFDRLRFVEIKHGRIAQLAFLGNVITRAGFRLPGDIDFPELPSILSPMDGLLLTQFLKRDSFRCFYSLDG